MEIQEFTQQEAEQRLEIGKIKAIDVRFFTYAHVDGQLEEVEITEAEFRDIEGTIEYYRDSIAENGVRQIRLIIDPI